MLKKLLASALAVATVASCAYVPSALASAATTYKTATVVDYMDWELKNPPATETKETATIYVSSNANIAGTYALKVAAGDNNADYVKSKIADAKKTTDNATKLPAIKPDSTDLTRYVLSYFGAAGNGTYVAQITEERAVVYSEWDENFADGKVANTTAAELAKKHAKLLGYYSDPAAASVVADMYKANLTGKLAGQDFLRWVNNEDGTIKPAFQPITFNNIYYTKVKMSWLANSVEYPASVANRVATGLYINDASMAQGADEFVLPNNDSANWNTYLYNWLLTNGNYGDIFTVDVLKAADSQPGDVDDYTVSSVRYVGVKNEQKQYAVVYSKDAKTDGKDVTYTLTITDKVTNNPVATWTGKEQVADFYYTTDVAEIYKIIKADPNANGNFADKATLADYLVKDKDNGYYYTLTDKYVERTVVNNDSTPAHSVTINIYVERADKYTVYSYAADNTMKKSDAFLTAAQLDETYYANQDGNDNLAQNKKVLKVTAAELGVAAEATIDGVPATFAYVATEAEGGIDTVGKEIYTTYKMGDATVALSDFQTATGAFKSQPYFGRDAKVGDQVTLKVSLAETGVAKKLDLTKLEVAYSVVGATVVKTNYDYTATEFPAGEAIDITLGQGTNIVTATVSYNGVKIGTFEPFYAYVAE